jgi:hypothetical protein
MNDNMTIAIFGVDPWPLGVCSILVTKDQHDDCHCARYVLASISAQVRETCPPGTRRLVIDAKAGWALPAAILLLRMVVGESTTTETPRRAQRLHSLCNQRGRPC